MGAGCRRPRPRRGESGFTLAELLLLVAFLALFAVLALPRVSAGLRLGGVERAARILDAGVAAARERAVSTGRPHALVLDLDLEQVRVEEVGESGPRRLDEARYRGVSLPRGVRLAVWTAGAGSSDAAGPAGGVLRRSGVARVRAEPDGTVEPARFLFDDAPALEVHPLTGLVGLPRERIAAAPPPPVGAS